jgi:MFS family permease
MRPSQEQLRQGLFSGINPVIRFLTMSDVILLGAMQLVSPIFALFIVDRIPDANAAVVGAAASVYLITKSIGQIPFATLIDRIRGERDDFWFLFSGTIVISLLPLLYLIIQTPMQLYIVQFFIGVCAAMTYPPYMAIFTRHIDRKREATEWGIRFTLIDLAGAISASLGGLVAVSAGFTWLIIGFVCINMLGALILLPARRYMRR